MFIFPRRTPFNYLVLNLAVADMTVAIFFTPKYIFFYAFTHPDGEAGNVLCKLLTGANIGWIAAVASVFSLAALAIERYYAVVYPHGNKGKLTKNRLKVSLNLYVLVLLKFCVRNFYFQILVVWTKLIRIGFS